MTNTQPDTHHWLVGRKVRALTTTATAQKCVIEVASVQDVIDAGWIVWGYRQYKTRGFARASMYPQQYFVPTVVQP